MASRRVSTEAAVAETAARSDLRAAAGGRAAAPAPATGPGSSDPLLAVLRRAGLLRLLVAVNPSTMYSRLRALEADGLVAGEWEHPERRSRRFYRLTDAGAAERSRLASLIVPRLDDRAAAVDVIRSEPLAG